MVNFWLGVGAALGLLVGMVLHEYVHARAAVAMGDKSPKAFGKLTLNPKAHVDPVGTIIMPILFVLPIMTGRSFGMIFGYVRPIPLNPRAMRGGRGAPFFVAIVGPLTNFALAIAGGAVLRFGGVGLGSTPYLLAAGFLTANSFLALINVLPIPPLDGSRILGLFLSPSAAYKMEELSQYFILFLVALFLFFRGVIAALTDPVCSAASLNVFPGCPL